MTVFVLTLRWLTPMQAALVAGAAVALNWVVLPVTGLERRLRREGEPFVNGLKLYPVAVLLVLLLFPLDVAAMAWVALGIGDAASNIVGRRLGRPPFLGRHDRSLAGTLAFVLTAWPLGVAAAAWTAPSADTVALWSYVTAAAAASVAGAAMEYVRWPRPLDDNLPIALAAGTAAWAVLA